MTRLILASRSPARLSTLRQAGIEPVVVVSEVDEDAAAAGHTAPEEVCLVLARAKAEKVAARLPDPAGDELVVGCDSVLEFDGRVWGKPHDAATARARWRAMRSGTATLHTGHWVVDARDAEHGGSGGALGAHAATRVHFADPSDEEIDAYVATGEPLEVAGAFTIDGLGGAFVRGVEGDHHSVVGISLPLLRELVGRLGVSWPGLWNR